ncbi:GTPase of the mitochondrial inner membrane that associates with the large ribosomal subunit [Basidiobolus ranarum]|uniref:GTPase of the mitochondrial inner membrane that associates with the large ribosomal subunit n=1 Tax=Basidiobolus ranarum TaxID=34480 RepID=A0ABR2WY10_9FUNG
MFPIRRFIQLDRLGLCSKVTHPLKRNSTVFCRLLSAQPSFATEVSLKSPTKKPRSVFDIDKAELRAFVNGWDNDTDIYEEEFNSNDMYRDCTDSSNSVSCSPRRIQTRSKYGDNYREKDLGFEIEQRQHASDTMNIHTNESDYEIVGRDKHIVPLDELSNIENESIEFDKNFSENSVDFDDSTGLDTSLECGERLIFEDDDVKYKRSIKPANLQKLKHDITEIDERIEFENVVAAKPVNKYDFQFETKKGDLGDYIPGLTYSRWAQNSSTDKKVILEDIDLEYVEQRTFSRLLQKLNSNPHRLMNDLYIDENVTVDQLQRNRSQLERVARERRSNMNKSDLPTFRAEVDEKLLYLDESEKSSRKSRKALRNYEVENDDYSPKNPKKYVEYDSAALSSQPNVVNQTEAIAGQRTERERLRYTDNKVADYCDFKQVLVAGGYGGDGCVSFLKAKHGLKITADGGDGGQGGSIYFEATKDLASLSSVSLKIHGRRGFNGKARAQEGKSGADVIIRVPVGTVVREVDLPNENEEFSEAKNDYFIHYPGWTKKNLNNKFTDIVYPFTSPHRQEKRELDFEVDGQKHLLCYGGQGGFGNPYFANKENKHPKFATKGLRGQVRCLELELKTIADAGLVGLPNAGKSTFLRSISNAYPKVGPYPFTTVNPCVGTVQYPDFYRITMADIPGLVEGAHQNMGLGNSFLRHIERSNILVYVIDLSKEAPWNDLNLLRSELELYKPGLTKRPSLIIGNKADISNVAKGNFEHFQSIVEHQIIPVSAKLGKNINKATSVLREMMENLKR